jgi:hypothetical protein
VAAVWVWCTRPADARLHRLLALKFLTEALAKDHQALERFQRAAQAASALKGNEGIVWLSFPEGRYSAQWCRRAESGDFFRVADSGALSVVPETGAE